MHPSISAVYRAAIACIALLLAPATFAAPVTYTFTTGPASTVLPLTHPFLLPLLPGTGSGRFDYDSAAPVLATPFNGLGFTNGSIYRALSSLTGTVGSLAFSDPDSGLVLVSDDGFVGAGPPDPSDTVVFVAQSTAEPFTLNGFSVSGGNGTFVLVNVRMFWLEDIAYGTADFLSNQDLPAEPPSVNGFLALDFVREQELANPTAQRLFAFFPLQSISPVQVPAPAGLLFALGVFGLALRRSR